MPQKKKNDSLDDAKKIIAPILRQIGSVRKALSLWEGIEKCAKEVNEQRGLAGTFGFIQFVVGKIYDLAFTACVDPTE